MQNIEFNLKKIDLTVSNMDMMAKFYGNVFDINLKTVEMGPFKCFIGKIPRLFTLQLVPKEITGNNAKQNRQQLNFQVNDLEEIKKRALANGGNDVSDPSDRSTFSVKDPDGNYIVFSK